MNTPKISIVIPVFNEAGAIGPLARETAKVLGKASYTFELLVVDDGSTDETAANLEALLAEIPQLRILTLRRNYGQTPALLAGMDESRGEIIVTLDGDGQNDPNDIIELVGAIESGFDCVLGWRRQRKDLWLSRKLPSQIANYFIRWLWKTDIRDFGCGLKAIRKKILSEVSLHGEMHRLLGILLLSSGAKIKSVPVNHRPRTTGTSKYGLERTLKVLLDMMTIWFLDHFKGKPSHAFGHVAFLLLGSAGLFSTIVVFQKVFEGTSLNRNPLFFFSIFLGITAIQFLSMGLIAELLSRNYFEATRKKPYGIEKDSLKSERTRSIKSA